MSVVVAALYKFVALPDFRELREPLLEHCRSNGLLGTLLLAEEGINGTVSGSRQALEQLQVWLQADGRFDGLEYKESLHEKQPFLRMKVKLKREIVTMGVPSIDPKHLVGTYVEADDWDAVLADPDVTVLDTRNDYECAIGSFAGAINPGLKNFREFPDWAKANLDPGENRKIAMFCTGGIRCEKASSFLLEQGFNEVYHLRGGILRYLEETPDTKSSWKGECFVFDERVAVNHALERGSYEQCFACRRPLSAGEMQSEDYVKGVSCPHCIEHHSDQSRERFAERQRQIELARERGDIHIGSPTQVGGQS
ncbi:MAG: rhodanese-related sulfurtransferase [Congregibacter sp.]